MYSLFFTGCYLSSATLAKNCTITLIVNQRSLRKRKEHFNQGGGFRIMVSSDPKKIKTGIFNAGGRGVGGGAVFLHMLHD